MVGDLRPRVGQVVEPEMPEDILAVQVLNAYKFERFQLRNCQVQQ